MWDGEEAAAWHEEEKEESALLGRQLSDVAAGIVMHSCSFSFSFGRTLSHNIFWLAHRVQGVSDSCATRS